MPGNDRPPEDDDPHEITFHFGEASTETCEEDGVVYVFLSDDGWTFPPAPDQS
jgi:hypothetical protein